MVQVTKKFPNCKKVASILRNIYSVEDSQWTALLLSEGKFYETTTYNMHVMEGVAAGDAFGAGLIHGLVSGFDEAKMIQFAFSCQCLEVDDHWRFEFSFRSRNQSSCPKWEWRTLI